MENQARTVDCLGGEDVGANRVQICTQMDDQSQTVDCLDVADVGMNRFQICMPMSHKEVFNFICSQNLPNIKDETPPWEFYAEELESKIIELARNQYGTLMVTLGSQTQLDIKNDGVYKSEKKSEEKLEEKLQEKFEEKLQEKLAKLIDIKVQAQPKTRRFFTNWRGIAKKTVLTVSLIHSAFAVGNVVVRVWGNFNGNSAAAAAVANPELLSVPVSVWRHFALKLAGLASIASLLTMGFNRGA